MRWELLLWFCFIAGGMHAGGEFHQGGGRFQGMGNAAVAVNDLWNTDHNCGGLGFLRRPALGAGFTNYFLLSSTGISSFAAVLPVKQGTFGLSLSNSGYAQYSEFLTGISFGKSFGDKISAGIRLDHLQIAQGAEYGKKQLLMAELGFMSKLSSKLTFGAHLFNPTRSKIHEWQNERVPTVLSAGFAYTFSDKALASLEVEKNSYYAADIRAGLEYKPVREVALRMGFNTRPQTVTFGVGMQFPAFSLDLASSWHSVLGFSPGISLQYHFR